MIPPRFVVLAALCLLLLQSCGSGGPAPVTNTSPPTNATTIKHIVVIMQENRTTDNLFNGFPGADTVQTAKQKGTTVSLQSVPLEQGNDVDHSHLAWLQSYDNGLLDNFAHDNYSTQYFPYAYVPQSETVPLFTLAKAYTFGDRMFQSNTGPSFVAHQYMIAGQSGDAAENPTAPPWGCDASAANTVALIGPNGTELPGVYPCFDYQTIADLLDAKGVTWKYYTVPISGPGEILPGTGDIWSAFDAIKHIRYGSDWTTNVIPSPPQVLTDIQNGKLAQVTWVMPAYTYSDHAGVGATAEGPDWVADVVNAVGASPFWNSTAIFITWDDWGGWYDHVVPPQIDNMGYGFRVPLIIVSPYVKHGYISEKLHEPSGFLTYMEETFTLPNLGQRDVKADDFADCFDYTQTPQPYTQVPVKFNPAYFMAKKDLSPPDND
jgi:phospholipase C